MKIGVIGTGNVGKVLGTRWAKSGHQVIFGSRDPQSERIHELLQAAGANARATSAPEAATASEVIVLATPWTGTQQVVQLLGNLSGKIVVDCTNPLEPNLRGLSLGHTASAGELVASWAQGAHVVKAFNMTGAKNMSDPKYGAQSAAMFICGDDAEAKAKVIGLAKELDFDVIDAGPLTVSRYLEPLAMLWIHLAYVQGMGSDFAFAVLRK